MTLSADTVNETKRKSKKKNSDNYFDEKEESAVRLYLSASTFEEKNKIYNQSV